mgnify:CR=1 FL=1
MLSYRKLAMRVLGRPLHTGESDSPRPASQRAAAFILTAAMLTTLAAPAFAKTWYIENGDITISAGKDGNDVTQNEKTTYGDKDTVITNQKTDTASSNTVTIDAGSDKVEVTLKDVNIDTSSRNKAAVSVTGSGNTTIKLDGDNALKSDTSRSGIYGSGSLTISGGENDSLTAQGGSGANGISSSGSLTISGGTVTATGGNSTGIVGYGGSGIYSSSGVAISGGAVTANGGDSKDGSGGNGIYSSGSVAISGGTVTANGGSGGNGGGRSGGFGRPADGESGPARRFARAAQPQRSGTPDPALVQTPRPSTDGMRRVGVRQAMDGGLSSGSAAPVSGEYAVGQRVEHPKFGVGIVERIEVLATDHKLVVAFDNAGEKTLLAKFAKLTKL